MRFDPNDLVCAQCGEPYTVGHVQADMEAEDKEAFLNGEGCPTCDWGDGDAATGEYVNEHKQRLIHGNFDGDPAKYI